MAELDGGAGDTGTENGEGTTEGGNGNQSQSQDNQSQSQDNGTALDGGENQEGSTALDGGETKDNSAQTSAPEKYEDFTLPEGVSLTPEQMEGFKEIAKGNDFTQEVAQKAVDMHLKLTTALQEKGAEDWKKQTGEWLEASKKDTEFGGQAYSDNLKIANQAIKKFGTPELVTLFKEYGVGNHPELIRFAYRIGKAIKDDDVHGGTASANEGNVSTLDAAAKKIYGSK